MTATAKIPPKPGKETIYIDVDDEITAIIDKVDSAKEKIVALVLPKRAAVLQSIVNMRLLKRNAEKAGKNVVLITGEEALLPLAGAAGLHVAKNLQSKPEVPAAPTAAARASRSEPVEDIDAPEEEPTTKLDYHRSVGELATAAAGDEAIDLDDEDADADAEDDAETPTAAKGKKPKNKGLKVPNFDRFRLLLAIGICLLIGLAVFIYLAISVLPKASIAITTGSLPVSANLTINASDSVKALDEKNNAIPAVLKTTQQTQTETVPATGQQNNGTKATGMITITNCTNSEVTIPAGTGISGGGLTYITQQDLDLQSGNFDSHGNCKPNGSHVGPVNVTATQGGSAYNQPASSYTVAGFPGLTGSSLQVQTKGTDNVITVVSQTDLNNAAAKMTDAATASFTKNFEDQLAAQGLYVFTSTLKPGTPATTANPALGQQASNTTVTTTTTYSVLAVNKSDFTKLITDNLNKQIDPTKQKLSSTNVLTDSTISVQGQSSPSSATVSVDISTTAVPIIDVANIKKQAAGQKSGDIKAAVQGLPGVKSVTVTLSPFWVSKAPKNTAKITVVQLQVKDSGS